jgi:hypothetical protein
VRECRSIISYCGISALAKSDQFFTSAVEAVAVRDELKSRKDATNLGEAIAVFRTNQEMKVHETRSRCHIEPHLDVREDELNVGKAPGKALPKHFFVRVCDVIVCNSNGFNFGRRTF